jgi:hypothetical protein
LAICDFFLPEQPVNIIVLLKLLFVFHKVFNCYPAFSFIKLAIFFIMSYFCLLQTYLVLFPSFLV